MTDLDRERMRMRELWNRIAQSADLARQPTRAHLAECRVEFPAVVDDLDAKDAEIARLAGERNYWKNAHDTMSSCKQSASAQFADEVSRSRTAEARVAALEEAERNARISALEECWAFTDRNWPEADSLLDFLNDALARARSLRPEKEG